MNLKPFKSDFSPAAPRLSRLDSPVRTNATGGVAKVGGGGGLDTALADRASGTLERVLSQYGSGIQPVSSKDPFERLGSLTQQVSDLFQKDPTALEQVRADKQLYSAIQRIAKQMGSRLPYLDPRQAQIFQGFMALAARMEPIEPKPILP